jgi:hypothetical protein
MSTVLTVLKYDFKRFLRDWLMVAFSVAMILMYVAVILWVPADITPDWKIAVTKSSAAALEKVLEGDLEEDGQVTLVVFDTEEELRAVFEDKKKGDEESDEKKKDDEEVEDDFFVGIAIDEDAKAQFARGEKPKARVYIDESSPPEVQETARAIGAMIAMASFFPQDRAASEPERLGPTIDQADFKERMKGLMAALILVMELLAFASLMSREISSGVVHAILTTTVSMPRYFVAKMTFGITLAFVQAAGLALLAGALKSAPHFILLQLFFGAILFTAAGMISGTRGRHLMEVIMWSFVFMLPAMVPAFAVMIPGSPSLIVQAMPSYPLIEGVITAGQASPLYSPWLLVGWTAAWAAGMSGIAYVALRRRVK